MECCTVVVVTVHSLYTVHRTGQGRTGWSLMVVSWWLPVYCVVTTKNIQHHSNTQTILSTSEYQILNSSHTNNQLLKPPTNICQSTKRKYWNPLVLPEGSGSIMLRKAVVMLSLVTAVVSDVSNPVLSSATHLRRDFSVFSHNKKVKLGHTIKV